MRCDAWLYGVHRCQDGSSFEWHQPRKNQTALQLHHFGGHSKRAVKSYSHSFRVACDNKGCSECAREQRTALYKGDQQQLTYSYLHSWAQCAVLKSQMFHAVPSVVIMPQPWSLSALSLLPPLWTDWTVGRQRDSFVCFAQRLSFAPVILSVTVLISESGVAHTVATSYPFCRKESSPQSSVSLGSVGQVPRHGADIDNDRHSVPLTDKGSSLFIRYISIYMHTCSVYIHVYIHVQVWGNCCTHYLPAQHWRNYSLLLLAEVESANINNQTNSKQTEPQLTFL